MKRPPINLPKRPPINLPHKEQDTREELLSNDYSKKRKEQWMEKHGISRSDLFKSDLSKSDLSRTDISKSDLARSDFGVNMDGTWHHKDQLCFDAAFESGNLAQAELVQCQRSTTTTTMYQEYRLFVQNDLNTDGWTQWFFFRVSNLQKNCFYRFKIVNMVKKDSMFSSGVQPLMYFRDHWKRNGFDVSWEANHQPVNDIPDSTYYTLSWSFICDHDEDSVYWAQCYPYTFSQLESYLNCLDAQNYSFLKRDVLCQTVCENDVSILTITDASNDDPVPAIVISARVHPGETNSSYMMQGLIDYLVSDAPISMELRKNFVFKIVPMMNPDGVIVGNYRSNLSAIDLNRAWLNTSKKCCPEVYYMKQMILQLQKERSVSFFIDLHGHSQKKKMFFFGNSHRFRSKKLKIRLFPFLMSKLSPFIHYPYCSFNSSRNKRSTARVVTYKELNLERSYTLESSLGADFDHQYSINDYETMGRDLLVGIKNFQDKEYCRQLMKELDRVTPKFPKKKSEPSKKFQDIQKANYYVLLYIVIPLGVLLLWYIVSCLFFSPLKSE